MAQWANSGGTGLDVLVRVQRSLTVNLIMVPRERLLTCQRDEKVSEVNFRNEQHYSCLPVIDSESRQILGLYNAERCFDDAAPDKHIGEDFEKFSEEIVIGADASIIDFVKVADKQPTRLVISGNRVAGLVSLSDLQLLPVRAAIFTLLTRLEMTMAQRIEDKFPNPMDWLALLSEGRQNKIKEEIVNAKENDRFVSEIALSQLADKVDIIVKYQLIQGSKKKLREDFKKIKNLRNSIAHASHYAESPEAAFVVCRTIGLTLDFLEKLSE